MYENRDTAPQRALLCGVDTGEYDVEVSLDELAELAATAGAQVVGRAVQRRAQYDAALLIGRGKLEEIAAVCQQQGADLLLFDHELTASQLRNIEQVAGVPVVDRTMLILDIFAQRAHTAEGRLQVELAQLRYRLPRLAGLGGSLSRLGGGIGTRGPGETKLESDRRHIRGRIASLERQLADLTRRREQQRARRKKEGVTTVAILGYTNVGKSTLLNALTDAGVLAQDMLFATLDPTARALLLPDGRQVLLIDTVGLVRRLPHHLVEAFKSTLEEAAGADLILNVCDGASPELEDQLAVVRGLLRELSAEQIPLLTVLNKCDLLPAPPPLPGGPCVCISAKTGWGFPQLLERIAALLPPTQHRLRLLIPYAEGGLLTLIRQEGKVFSEQYQPEGTLVDALVERSILHRVREYIVR